MTKTMAITGASGFVGGAIARHFIAQGWRVIGFGRRPIQIEGLDYRIWDIQSARNRFPETVDVLVHSAAKVDDFGDYASFYRANVLGSQNIVDCFKDAGQFIYISSSSVYDPFTTHSQPIPETFPYGEGYLNAYGQTKMLAEKLLLAEIPNNLVILRPRAVYGMGDTTLLPRLVRAKKGRFLLGIGDGKNEFSLTYIGNLLHALDAVVARNFGQAIFNIADEKTLNLATLLQALADYMRWNVQIIYLPQALAEGIAGLGEWAYAHLPLNGSPSLTRYAVYQLSSPYRLDLSKAKALLDYAPPYTYREAFALMREWLKEKQEA